VPLVATGGAKRFTVTYSEAMNRTSAERALSYDIRMAGKDRKFGTRDDVKVRINSAVYAPSGHSVALGFLKKIAVGSTIRITVLGTSNVGVTDEAGNLLAGGDHVVLLKIKATKTKA
jgi:hypothetical protein